jgi:NAD(P)-dependent dehydrogenase (short-subunit alcohol dehydrogenase family)
MLKRYSQNAGLPNPGVPLEELTLDAFQKVINVNLSAPFLCTREAFKVFKKQSPPGGQSSYLYSCAA